MILRLSPGEAPGGFLPALFLPLAAVVSFPVATDRRWAWRAALCAGAAVPLTWLAAAGRVPAEMANPLVFLGVAAAAMSLLVGLAVRALLFGLSREAFGYRQLAVAALTAILGLGLLLQSADALRGAWAVGDGRIPPAWPVVATADGPHFRVLWLGRPGMARFPPPGGSPDGAVAAGEASVRYGVTGRAGDTVLEVGLPADGPGYAALEDALREILGGRVRHGGALLAPFGIRFVVAGTGDLPAEAAARFSEQLELDLIQTAGGLSIYEAASPLPIAAAVGPESAEAAESAGLGPSVGVAGAPHAALAPHEGMWEGRVPFEGSGAVLFSTPFDRRWRLTTDGEPGQAIRAFGWSQGFGATFPADDVRLSYAGKWVRTLEIAALALLWAAALWFTRVRASPRPVAAPSGRPELDRGEPVPVEAAS